MSRFRILVILYLVALISTLPAAAEPCGCSPPGCDCACECSHSGITTCNISRSCHVNQRANCTCSETTCTASCTTNTNQGIGTSSEFLHFEINAGLLAAVGQHVREIDSGWAVMYDSGLGTGMPLTQTYTWSSGLDFGTFLNTLADEFSACAEIDWTNEIVTFRPVGDCS